MAVTFEPGSVKRASSSSCFAESLESNGADEALGPLLVAAADSWKLSSDLPYFDARLVVDTCAQFVSSSYQARTSNGEVGSRRAGNVISRNMGNNSNVPMLQAMTSHAHEFNGADRLITELVPRCREYKGQLLQTVKPLCAEMRGLNNHGGTVNEVVMEYEVERFFRARLVECDLSELLTYDCFADAQDDDLALARHIAVTKIPKVDEAEVDNRDYKPSYDAELELSIERFELRFWRSFAHGLGVSFFGDKRPDLVERFEASAQDVFDRYEGELQLAMNSLMGWLPSWLSESLFIAFVGLGASVAVRQRSAKYTMLHRCVKSLLQSSGRYVFISTPGWYLPLVNWLPGLGRKEVLRMPSVMLSLSLRTVWPSPCLDPDRCVATVDEVWGGPKGDRKAHLKLADGVEAMGSWILRMTFGCERLFSRALQVVREFAPIYEEAFEILEENGTIKPCDLPFNQAEARTLTQDWAAKVHHLGNSRKRKTIRSVKSSAKLRSSKASISGAIKRGSACSTRFNYDLASRVAAARKAEATKTAGSSSAAQLSNISHMNNKSRMPNFASWERGGDDDDYQQPSLLAQLHADSHGPTTSSEPRLRSVIQTGEGDDIVWWPLGQSDTFRERIPIHRTPDLLPTAAPPILEDMPGDFMLPDSAVDDDGTPHSRLMSNAVSRSVSRATISSRSPERTPRRFDNMAPTPRSQGSTKSPRSKSKKKSKVASKEAFDPAGWQLQWFGLGCSSQLGGLTSSQSAPLLTMPEDFRETLDRMWQARKSEVGPKKARTKNNGRAKSSPAAFDTSDFNVGDPAKNSAVAYALQMQIRTSLSTACSEGPLRLSWRLPRSPEDAKVLLRTRLNLGTMLLMAAMRAPLPSWEQLPLSSFTVLDEDVVKHSARVEPPKVRLPDGVYAMGCSPLFHYIATEDSARVPPLMSQAFHVGVPHAFLEDGPMRDALVERHPQRRWSEGSLLVLFTAGALTEGHLARRAWAAERGWLQQDYASFFPLACCFRLILGLEFLNLFHRNRDSAEGQVRLESFLQFLEGSDSACRDVRIKLDMSAEDGEKPLYIAPWLLPQKASDPDLDPRTITEWDRACHPGNDGIALEDFATWVSSLRPGRMIYSSHRSPTGDIYLKLQNHLIILGFTCAARAKGPLSGQMIYDMYEDAIGDPEWWHVDMICYIAMAERISVPLETVMGSCPSLVYVTGEVVEGADETCPVRGKTEIVVCHPKMFNQFLGPVRAPVFAQTSLFNKEIGEDDDENKLLRQLWIQRNRQEVLDALQLEEAARQEQQQRDLQSRESERWEGSQLSAEMDLPSQPVSPKAIPEIVEEGVAMSNEELPHVEAVRPRASVIERLQLRHSKGFQGNKKTIKRGDNALVAAKRILSQQAGSRSPSKQAGPKLARGSAMNAVEWRTKRAGKPKAPQIGQNLDLLQGVLTYIEEHMQKFLEFAPDILNPSLSPSEISARSSPDPSRGGSRGVSFRAGEPDTPTGPRPNSRPHTTDETLKSRGEADVSCGPGANTLQVSPEHVGSMPKSRPTTSDGNPNSQGNVHISSKSEETNSRHASPENVVDQVLEDEDDNDIEVKETNERVQNIEPNDIELSIRVDSDTDDEFGEEREVRIERVPSPVRTDKSRKWRPPTPFPRFNWNALKSMNGIELAGMVVVPQGSRPLKGQRNRTKRDARPEFVKVDDTLVFDFCGFGNWKPILKDSSKQPKRQTRTSNSDIAQIMR